jgi:hypothetical protein
MYRNDEKILTEENLHNPIKTCPSATFASTNLTRAALECKTLNAELNPICHLLTLIGARHILQVSRIRVKSVLPSEWWQVSA